tara:strand:- start:44 stop:271 length:228 start_codon:yes stop_codon:yes gene_type:complete
MEFVSRYNWVLKIYMEIRKKMSERVKKKLNNYIKSLHKKNKEMNLVKNLKKEVEIGGNGTQKYVVKNGINKGKVL